MHKIAFRRLWIFLWLGLSACTVVTPSPTPAPSPTPVPAGAWRPVNPGGGGWFMCAGAGPTGVLIVCSDVSGAYRSLDHGQSWDVIGSTRGLKFTHVNAAGFDPKDDRILYLGLDGALYRSDDRGETFEVVQSGGYWGAITISAADPQVGYAGVIGLTAAIYKTTDRGLTWTPLKDPNFPEGLRVIRLVTHPTDPNIVYLISGQHRFGDGVPAAYRSVDGGQSWTPVAAELVPVFDLALDPENPKTLFVTVQDQGVFKSTDDGATWVQQGEAWGRLFVKSSQVVRVIENGAVWETQDGGGTWAVKSRSAQWTDPGWTPGWHFDGGEGISLGGDLSNPDAFYYVNQQFVYGSFDGGATFASLYTRETPAGSNQWSSTGVDNTEVYDLEISAADHNLIYVGYWDLGIWRSRDHGLTWGSLNQDDFGWEGGRGGDVKTILSDPERAPVVWAGAVRTAPGGKPSEHLIRSDNYGEPGSWVEVGDGLPDPAITAEIWGLSLDRNSPADRRTLFVTAGGKVFRSTDDGFHWEAVFSGGRARITAVDAFDGGVVYAGGSGVWRSIDGGGSWEKTGLPEMRNVFDIKTDPTHADWVYVVCYGNDLGLYRSQDRGATWEHLWTNSVARGVAVDPRTSDTLYVTSSLNDCCGAGPIGSAGVSRSLDGGRTWAEINEGLAWPFAWPVEVDPVDPTWVFIGAPGTGFYTRQFP